MTSAAPATVTAYVTDVRCHEHTLPGHVENADRLRAVHFRIAESGLEKRLLKLTPEPISDAQILSVHTEDYLNNVLKWSETQRGIMIGADTYALPQTLSIARLSAGAALRAVDAVLSGEAHNAFAATRPPGHHAVPDMAMGFCLLANVSLAVRHAQKQHGISKVMIVDYDVHHGNGTQEIFYADPNVLFLSTHQSPWYPGTGMIEETGTGPGVGATINVPLPAGVGDKGFSAVYEQIVWAAARRFQPELILVSAGFDSHWRDPLGQLKLSLSGYAHLSRELIRMAQSLCQGRIVFVMEGGYDLEVLSHGMLNVAYALLGDSTLSDPVGAASIRAESDVSRVIQRVKDAHSL